jgi:hypothetical protein
MRAIGCVAILLLASLGCDGSSEPAAGPPGTFGEIYTMLFPAETNARCNFCHGMPASNQSNGSLHMGTAKAIAYGALVDKSSASNKCGGKPLVVASKPGMSLFLQKLSATPPCGDRMPVGGKALSDVQLEMIRSWIADGAKDN